jgi:hypothetical protein
MRSGVKCAAQRRVLGLGLAARAPKRAALPLIPARGKLTQLVELLWHTIGVRGRCGCQTLGQNVSAPTTGPQGAQLRLPSPAKNLRQRIITSVAAVAEPEVLRTTT